MTLPPNFSFGLPTVPRQTMPSMFQILSWGQQTAPKQPVEAEIEQETHVEPSHQGEKVIKKEQIVEQSAPEAEPEAQIIANTSEVKSEYCKEHPRKRISKSTNTKYQIYEYQRNQVKRSQSQVSVGSKIIKDKKIQPSVQIVEKKKLDPTNQADLKQIEARLARIKKFELVTRDLPNSAWTTYYGKPAFEAYGRGGTSCSQLISHNVMPHKGTNNPKTLQSHYVALIKGQKAKSITHVPRNPIETQIVSAPQETRQVINLPLQAPDLINNPRFTAINPKDKQYTRIPSNKYTPVPDKKPKKAKKQRRRKLTRQAQSCADGLKYMNVRQKLAEQLEAKKMNASRLAWKVTQCYPYDIQNSQKLKESTLAWENKPVAGKASRVCDKVSDLIKPVDQNQ